MLTSPTAIRLGHWLLVFGESIKILSENIKEFAHTLQLFGSSQNPLYQSS